MSDILTALWLNIDKMSYMDKSRIQISNEDILLLKNSRRNMIIKPSVCLLVTFLFSKYRLNMWTSFKKYFISNRRKSLSFSELSVKDNITKTSPLQEIKIEYRNQFHYTYEESHKISLSKSRRIFSRRDKNSDESNSENSMNVSRELPTFSISYLGFLNKYKNNVRRFSFFKNYTFSAKEDIYNRGENFLVTSRFIYIPFFIILFFSLYDFLITYVALYFKFQPLIDEYYLKKNSTN